MSGPQQAWIPLCKGKTGHLDGKYSRLGWQVFKTVFEELAFWSAKSVRSSTPTGKHTSGEGTSVTPSREQPAKSGGYFGLMALNAIWVARFLCKPLTF
jgi:hypothetical protein